MKLLVVLQNAYHKSGRPLTRRQYEAALWSSYTGTMLRKMLPDGVDVHVDNASPQIGTTADSIFPADLDHLEKVIEYTAPDLVLGCGKIVQSGLEELGIDFLPAPHPAWRGLTNAQAQEIRETIEREKNGEAIR